MTDALAWIGQIADWLGRFFPRWVIISATEAGVKFVRGKRIVPMRPGIAWYWPASTEVKFYPTVRQPLNLPSQTVLTRDGKPVAVGGAFEYEVPDPTPLLTGVLDPDQTIRLVAAGAVHKVCSSLTYDELSNQRLLRLRLRREIRHRLEHLGVRVITATLTDFAPCRVLKLLQSTSID